MKLHLISEEARKWWTLAAVAFGLFMIMLDNTVVNVALPSIAADLQVGLSELEWIVTGYALTFASLMLTGGKLADLMGRRLIFIVGLAVFTLSSFVCGLASSGELLIAVVPFGEEVYLLIDVENVLTEPEKEELRNADLSLENVGTQNAERRT